MTQPAPTTEQIVDLLLQVAEEHTLVTDRPSDLSDWCTLCPWMPPHHTRGDQDWVAEAHARHVAEKQAEALTAALKDSNDA